MKITLVISQLNAGGAERVLSRLANHLVEQHDVTILTFASPEHVPFYPLNKKIQVIHLSLFKKKPKFLKKLWDILVKLKRLRDHFKTPSDAIISFMSTTNIAVLWMNRGLGNKIIVSERVDPAYHPMPWIIRYLRLKTYGWAHKIVVQTPTIANYFPPNLHPLIQIIPNAVQPCSQSYQVHEEVKHIISVGRLDPQKDHPTLLKAFARVVQKHPHLRLTIYGEGKERKKLEKLIHQLDLKGNVFLPGLTTDVQKALKEADIFVFPSRYEGFPNALCEAMAMGLPVIASACSGNLDVVREGVDGILFPVGDAEQLSDGIIELIENKKRRQSLSTHAKEIISRFSEASIWKLWEKVVD